MALEFAYITLSVLMFMILIYMANHAIQKSVDDKNKSRKKIILVIGGLIGFHLYTFSIAITGMLQNYDFPPRFVIFLIIPAFTFSGFFIYKNKNKKWIQTIPQHWLIFYQSFRILIETIFVFTVAKGILHPNVTIEGYNYDMVFGYTAPIIGILIMRNSTKFKSLAILWNYLGLAVISVIIFLFISTIYFPELYGSETYLMPTEFGKYPYVLVPGFLMPSAVFIHILSIVQLKKSK